MTENKKNGAITVENVSQKRQENNNREWPDTARLNDIPVTSPEKGWNIMYTSMKGNTYDTITPKLWKRIKRLAFQRFDGSESLFNACWNQYRAYLEGSIDDPENFDDVMQWLDEIAAEKVNNPQSVFYIYG